MTNAIIVIGGQDEADILNLILDRRRQNSVLELPHQLVGLLRQTEG
jgi:hypothetical protein